MQPLRPFPPIRIPLLMLCGLCVAGSAAQDSGIRALIVGEWVINDDLSDNTDDQVAEAIEAGATVGDSSIAGKTIIAAGHRNTNSMIASPMMMC